MCWNAALALKPHTLKILKKKKEKMSRALAIADSQFWDFSDRLLLINYSIYCWEITPRAPKQNLKSSSYF